MTNSKNNKIGLASEVSDAFGSAVSGAFKFNPPSHHFVPEMDAATKMERLYMEEIEGLDNGPTPEQIDELFEALGGSFK